MANRPMSDAPSISIILPTWCEEALIGSAVREALAIGAEVIVADGGSTDGTAAAARTAGARVVTAPRGRGPQLHAGACSARGDILLFLHADARLPPGARGAIHEALADASVLGGNFHLEFVPASFAARLFTWANDARRRWLRIYYGDSAIFVRRTAYESLGGFRALPIFEDYELVRRLERAGRTVYVRHVTVQASARRFERTPVRSLAIWTMLQILYSVLGVSPHQLARLYGMTSRRAMRPGDLR